MSLDKRLAVMRILDDQNNLGVRADSKAIAFLTALGLFAAFFIAFVKDIDPNVITVVLVIIYFLAAILAIWNVILAINPRIRGSVSGGKKNQLDPYKAAFFAEICKFASLSDYKECLDLMLKDEDTIVEVYSRQIYEVSRITAAKYKYTQRAVYFVVTALSIEFVLIIYLFVINAINK